MTPESSFRRALASQGLSAAADALLTVALAGSLFFTVDLDGARPRLLLYLGLSVAPFAVLAPVIGPYVDRIPGGHRIAAASACAARSVLCLALALHLRTLWFYPEAFAVLVLGKTYAVARRALVPALTSGPDALLTANSLFTRIGGLGTGAGALAGAGLLRLTAPGVVLLAAAAVYGTASVVSLTVAGMKSRHGLVGAHGLAQQGLASPATKVAMSSLRAATGFWLFLVAMALKEAGEPAWLLALAGGANGFGGLIGAWIAPLIRRVAAEGPILTGAVAAAALLAAIAATGLRAAVTLSQAPGRSRRRPVPSNLLSLVADPSHAPPAA